VSSQVVGKDKCDRVCSSAYQFDVSHKLKHLQSIVLPPRRMRIQSKRLLMKVSSLIRLAEHLIDFVFSEYKTWKKNSPFLYDMILR